MSQVQFPPGYRLEPIHKTHPRKQFQSGEPAVDSWLATKALQQHEKKLAVTKILLDETGLIAGYYTLASGQVDFSDLPLEMAKRLPRRLLPVAILAWLGIAQHEQGRGLGASLLAQALRDCYEAGKTIPFVALIVDCLNERVKAFYQGWDFAELPGYPNRMFLSAGHLDAMMQST